MSLGELYESYRVELWVAVCATVVTVAVGRLRAWVRGYDDVPPMLRELIAYLAGYLALFAATRGLGGWTRAAAMTLIACLALAVTLNGRAPLASWNYLTMLAAALVMAGVLWIVFGGLSLLGIDIAEWPTP